MTPAATVPLTITDEAAEYVRSLGLEAALERMVEHTREVIPGLRKIHVRVQPAYDLGDVDAVLIEAQVAGPCREGDSSWWDWNGWMTQTFPPEVFQYFSLMPDFEGANAR